MVGIGRDINLGSVLDGVPGRVQVCTTKVTPPAEQFPNPYFFFSFSLDSTRRSTDFDDCLFLFFVAPVSLGRSLGHLYSTLSARLVWFDFDMVRSSTDEVAMILPPSLRGSGYSIDTVV